MNGTKALVRFAAQNERGLLVAFLTLIACVWFSYQHTTKLIDNSQQVLHLHEVHERALTVLSLTTDMETGARGFVVTGDDRYLEPYRRASDDLKQQFRELRELIKEDPGLQGHLNALEPLLNEKIAFTGEIINLRLNLGLGPASRLIQSDKGNQLMKEIRKLLQGMSDADMKMLRQHQEESDAGNLYYTLLALVSASILLYVGGYVIYRQMRQRIRLAGDLREFTTLTEYGFDGFVKVDGEGTILFANHGYAGMIGRRPDEVIGTPWDAAIHGEDIESVSAAYKELRERGQAARVVRSIRSDGSVVTLHFTMTVLKDRGGASGGHYCLVRDITEWKKTEERLAQVVNLVDSSEDGIIGETLEGRIVSWSQGAERIFGCTREEVIGQASTFCVGHDGSDQKEPVVDRIKRGERISSVETDFQREDGVALNLSMNLVPMKNPQGQVIGLYKIVRDMTRLRQAEAALEATQAETAQLNGMEDLLQACLTEEEAAAIVAKCAQHLVPGWAGALCVINSSGTFVEALTSWGSPNCSTVFHPEDCFGLRRRQVHVEDKPRAGASCLHVDSAAAPVAGYMCLPMMAQGEIVGILHLQKGATSGGAVVPSCSWHPIDRLAQTMAERIGSALYNLRLRHILRDHSIRDSLTGLYNRRYMEDSLEREIQQAKRRQASVGVVVLNVNRFKELNTAYGHAAGDAVLHELGEFFKRHVRSGDVPCRYKEDLFVIILPNSQPEATFKRPDQLREQISGLRVEFNGQPLGSISVSVGVSSFPHDGGTWKDVLKTAFEGLYQSKAESSFNLPPNPDAPSPARLTHMPA